MSDDAPTVRAIPLRSRQRHRVRPKKARASEAETPSLAPVQVTATEPEAPIVLRMEAPPAPELAPRRRLGRVVAMVVGVASIMCVVALARTLAAGSHHALEPSAAPARMPEAASASIDVPLPPEAAPAPVEEPPTTDARTVREEARARLEKHELDEAIASGKSAVELDPTDATAWLILGAAQLEARRGVDAIASFRSCVKLAKTGPVGECRSFLR
jgi:cytochrome c-type biogenesis protein CcmH/NrfG